MSILIIKGFETLLLLASCLADLHLSFEFQLLGALLLLVFLNLLGCELVYIACGQPVFAYGP